MMEEDPETVRLSDRLVALLASTHDTSPPGDLLAAVTAKIDALEADPISPRVRDALLLDCAIDRDLLAPVMARIEAEIEAELARDDGALLGEVRAELARESERMQTERVVSEVSAELRSIGPRIEREMPRAVAERIKPADVIPLRKRHWALKAAAGAMAAAAAMMIYLRPVDPALAPIDLPQLDPGGEVHVDAVEFDGTVTVTEADGVAVIWLTDDLAT